MRSLLNVLGRPGCGVVPLALNGQGSALSFGCMGNRTFTGLRDEELYVAVPGDRWEALVQQSQDTTLGVNEAMGAYYRGKLSAAQAG